ncbi:MAG TPA: hypothetical protein VK002_12750 [Rubricoccaceae bacterium]|nr:hypothetical protein [Rubricoccaceae bacterium]
MSTATRARSTRRETRAPAAPTRRGRSKTRTPSNTAATTRRRKAAAARQHAPAPLAGFPGWADLGVGSKARKKSATKKVTKQVLAAKARRARFLDVAPSLRFGVWVLVGCIAATLYVGHVFATQATAAALQRAERENLQLHLTHERLQGAYDRMIGPDQILDRAAALGLVEGVAYGPTIRVMSE